MRRRQTEAVRSARRTLGISMWQVWLDYVSIGGSLSPATIEMFLCDQEGLDDHDFDLIVQTFNERFMDRQQDHPIAYSSDLPPS